MKCEMECNNEADIQVTLIDGDTANVCNECLNYLGGRKELTDVDCDGWRNSNCCSGAIDSDIGVCMSCKEHANTWCLDCEEFTSPENCPNYEIVD